MQNESQRTFNVNTLIVSELLPSQQIQPKLLGITRALLIGVRHAFGPRTGRAGNARWREHPSPLAELEIG